MKIYVILLPFVLFIVWVYGLGVVFIVPLFAASCVAVARIRRYQRADREYEVAYSQVTTYLEQLLCSYRRLGHAGKALEDCRTLFREDCLMGKAICQAMHILFTGEGVIDGDILDAAFASVERFYDSRRMRIIHR